MEKKSHIVVAVPGEEPEQFLLDGARVGVGRGADNQVTLDNDGVSGTHCEFRQSGDGGYAIVDLGSTNGTRVNGDRLEADKEFELGDGDRVLLAETVPLYFYLLGEGEEAPNVAASSDPETRETAAALASMGEKIAEMKAQEKELAAGIDEMKKELEERRQEVARMKTNIDKLEGELADKKEGDAPAEEIEKLEEELFTQTRRWKLMASDLEGQEQQLAGIQAPGAPSPQTPSAPAAPVPPAPPAAPAGQPVQPAATQPVQQPAATQPVQPAASQRLSAGQSGPPPAAAPAPAPAASQPIPAAQPTAPAQPPARSAGPPTVQIQQTNAGPPTVQLQKGGGDPPSLKKQEDSGPPDLRKQ